MKNDSVVFDKKSPVEFLAGLLVGEVYTDVFRWNHWGVELAVTH